MRGMVAWLGGAKSLYLSIEMRVAGETKYLMWKMIRFAFTAITSFSAYRSHEYILGFFCDDVWLSVRYNFCGVCFESPFPVGRLSCA